MNWFKRHWFILALLFLFFLGLYKTQGLITKGAAVVALVAALLDPVWWVWSIALWMLGFVFGFLPAKFYDWLPNYDYATAAYSSASYNAGQGSPK